MAKGEAASKVLIAYFRPFLENSRGGAQIFRQIFSHLHTQCGYFAFRRVPRYSSPGSDGALGFAFFTFNLEFVL